MFHIFLALCVATESDATQRNAKSKGIIGASLSEPHMGSKSFPRELCIYESMFVCVHLSVNALAL